MVLKPKRLYNINLDQQLFFKAEAILYEEPCWFSVPIFINCWSLSFVTDMNIDQSFREIYFIKQVQKGIGF